MKGRALGVQLVVKQFSGLGNQMFQYAAGRYYASRLAAGLRLAAEQASRAKSMGSFARPMLLSHFLIEAPSAEANLLDRLFLANSPKVQHLMRPLSRLMRAEVFRERPAQEHHFLRELPVRRGTGTLFLEGYWQVHAIADAMRPALLREFTLRQPPSGANADMLRQIAAADCAVSLHVRRGDYALIGAGSMVLPPAYYHRAVQVMRERFPRATFFVFSDEVEYARACLPPETPAFFVEGNDDFSSHEDLRLMSACRHHITANSSFSWWGAWLNPREDKVVIAPKYWAGTPESYFPDRCPPEWHLLDHRS